MQGRVAELARDHGFSVRQVCWGYRDVFARSLEGLLAEGRIGAGRQRQTRVVFDLLKEADSGCYDHVLHQFLVALNPTNAWLFDLPALFEEVVGLGGELGRDRFLHGVRYFERLAAGGFGDSPAEVRRLLTYMRRLREHGDDLAMALLEGYKHLRTRLKPAELERYLESAVISHHREPAIGCRFLRGELASCESYIRALTRECRLTDVADRLRHLLRALTGSGYEVADLGGLDSDDLHELGATTCCFGDHLYVPERVRISERPGRNRGWYVAAACWAAALRRVDGFVRVHGHPDLQRSADLVGGAPLAVQLFATADYARAARFLIARWPGAAGLCRAVLAREREVRDHAGLRLLAELLAESPSPPLVGLAQTTAAATTCFDLATRLTALPTDALVAAYPDLAARHLPAPAFLPDYRYPASPEQPPPDRLVADLRRSGERGGRDRTGDEARQQAATRRSGDGDADEEAVETNAEAPSAGFVYPEWSQAEGAYHPDHCVVYEDRARARGDRAPAAGVAVEAARVARAFERLRPDENRRESLLPEGESMDTDRLIRFLADRRHEPAPRVDFFCSIRPRLRDLAVGVLLDVSGSTGERCADGQVLDLERHAALILGSGLHAIGDAFELAGFSSNGPERCEYLLIKGYGEDWNAEVATRLAGLRPRDSTRIGPALRHAGQRLARTGHRQQLLLLITDGQPQDRGYDPHSRYAQYDVRMACEENRRLDIHTFGISTTANSLGDMEIMFPARRFAILPDMRRLPRVLPALFTRLTC